MHNIKYTFLLPAYKTKFFVEALESIKNQTYRNFVCLVSDDCSPEDLKSIFDDIVGEDSRFTYRRNAENMGGKSLVSHWNFLVDFCDTEFLIMASDDDVYELDFLEEVNNLTETYPEIDLVRARVNSIDENGNVLNCDGLFANYEDRMQFLRSHFSDDNMKCLANHVFRTAVLKKKGGFHETPLGWYSDQITAIKLADNGCANTSDVLFHFRYSTQNISGAKPTKRVASQKALATMKADRWFSDYLKKEGIKDLTYRRWGAQIYFWLMDADFKTYVTLLPILFCSGLWDKDWMNAITRHQLKMLLLHR